MISRLIVSFMGASVIGHGLMLLYICFTDDLLPTDANTNEAADDDRRQYIFDPSKSNNMFDKADDQSDEYDPPNDEEFQAIENNSNANNEATMKPIMKMNTIQTVMTGCQTMLTRQ
jgi:hypothetical protein